jgi:site-specific DNA recombinase
VKRSSATTNRSSSNAAPRKPIRCAIYTRKSTEEGLQQEFNTLDAQRESAEAYISSQQHEGWVCLPDRYDDGGYSGGSIERPAVKRLMADIEAGKVDCVIVYKVDRLSRSLMDFSRMMQTFETHDVSFVSVTQAFNTIHSMGRLTLNILLSFAQFEREIISERTRDKIAAARRKGRFAGGKPVLGYDLASSAAGGRLTVNDLEAQQVRAIFDRYLQHGSLLPTVKELNERGWTTKQWTTKAGKVTGGRVWGKSEVFKLLTNITYLGKVRYRDEVHPGLHEAIVDEPVWQRVQATLQRNGKTGGALVRNKYGALLKGILRCGTCGCAMTHSYTSRKTTTGTKRYRYYTCLNAQKRGWATCATKSVPAGEIERFVVEQIKAIGRDPVLLVATVGQIREQVERESRDLTAEQKLVARDLSRQQKVLDTASGRAAAAARQRIETLERRADEVRRELAGCRERSIDQSEVEAALSAFDPVWEALSPREQARLIALLIERVEYDGQAGTLSLSFHPTGLKNLAEQPLAEQPLEAAA